MNQNLKNRIRTHKKILIMEDNEDLNEMYKVTFDPEFQVETSFNGKEGVEKVKSFHPDVILLDILMPEMEGDEALKIIQNISPEAKVIIISNLSREEIEKRVKLSDNIKIITKFNNTPCKLLGEIKDILKQKYPHKKINLSQDCKVPNKPDQT